LLLVAFLLVNAPNCHLSLVLASRLSELDKTRGLELKTEAMTIVLLAPNQKSKLAPIVEITCELKFNTHIAAITVEFA